MIIDFVLNGKKVRLNSKPERRLVDILRDRYNISSISGDCYRGICGKCMVLLQGRPVPSCLVLAANIRNKEVMTLEGFRNTDEYRDIEDAFKEAGVNLCEPVKPALILLIHDLIQREENPEQSEIRSMFRSLETRCGGESTLFRAVHLAAYFRRSRNGS